jgi:hypothetical protein
VRALLDEAAAIEHADVVRLLHGGKPVGDDKAGAVRAEVFERLLDEPLGAVVKRGGGLV